MSRAKTGRNVSSGSPRNVVRTPGSSARRSSARSRVAQASLELLQHRFLLGRLDVLDRQRHQRDDDDQERQAVEAEAGRAAPCRERAPASSGPNTRARLNWIEFSAIAFGRSFFCDQRGDQRLIGRSAEGLASPATNESSRMSTTRTAEEDERRQRERRGHLDVLRAERARDGDRGDRRRPRRSA